MLGGRYIGSEEDDVRDWLAGRMPVATLDVTESEEPFSD
jgi:hypothetical protein